jgi:aspartyl-tRNA(Asn)/glutamyl-tRNA(Gln) amidotransferase subunit C
MISKDEVKHIAELARIKLTESQIEKYQKELSGILDFVGKLSEVKTENIQPIKQITGLESVFRKDENRGLLDQNQGQTLIKQVPEHRDCFVVVPEVIKRDK